MSVANSLLSKSVTDQSAQIANLTAQVVALTTSVSANSVAVSANATQISSLVAATAQAVTTLSIPNSVGYPFLNETIEVLYDDALVPGNYAFRISGAFSSPTGSNNTATLELENTAAGATYLLQISGALNVTTVSYTGFLTYANAGPNPKISIKYNTGDASNWGWASLSIVFYRLSTAP